MPRSCYLTTPIHDSERVVLIASKGGDDRNPDWYRNLQAHPDAFLVIDGQRHAVHARTASAEGKGRVMAEDRCVIQGLRRLSAADGPRHSGSDLPVADLSQCEDSGRPAGAR